MQTFSIKGIKTAALIRKLFTYIFLLAGFSAWGQVRPVSEGNMPQDTLIQPDTLFSQNDTLDVDSVISAESSESMILETAISYNALDSIIFSLDGRKVYLYNDAVVTYGEINLTADYIELDLDSKEVFAEGLPDTAGVVQGTPVFDDGTEEFECKTLRYNFETKKGIIYNVKTEQGEGFLQSEKAKKVDEESFIIEDGKYTTCDKDHPDFYLNLTKAKVISNNKIITGRAYMVLEDFPIYFPFLPFGFFPSTPTYSSGIVVPTYGEEVNRGFFLRNGGYYWAASQYFDLELTGDIYSKGSWASYITTNYKKRYKYSGSFKFSYNVNKFGEKSIPEEYSKQTGFSIRWSHSQDSKANPNQKFSASVNLSTSSFDRQNATDANSYLQTTKSSSISYSKNWDNSPFSLSASLAHSQNSRDSTMSLSLPKMTISMTKIYPFKRKNAVGGQKWYEKISIGYTGSIQNSIRGVKQSEILKQSLVKDWENGWKHSIPITLPTFTLLGHINFTPSVSYSERWYTKYIDENYLYDAVSNKGTVVTDTIYRFRRNYNYSFSLGASTTIYGMYQMTNPNSRLKAIRHKMTISVGAGYNPDFSDPKYGFWDSYIDKDGRTVYYNRFKNGIYGSAGSGESGAISFNLSNNIEAKVVPKNDTLDIQESKISLLDNLSINGSYNLVADSMNLSNISIRGRTTIKGVSVNFGGTLNPYMTDSLGNPIAEYTWNHEKGLAKLGRLTNANLSFGMSFDSENIGSGDENSEEEESSDSGLIDDGIYADFHMPWSFRFNYSFNYSNPNPYRKARISQSINFSGQLSLTDKWNMSLNTNYDIQRGAFSFTTFSVNRSLHCFNMAFSFVPFGYRKSYSFTLSASSSMLKDLKIFKQRSWYDN